MSNDNGTHCTELFCQALKKRRRFLPDSRVGHNSYHCAAEDTAESYVLAKDNCRVIPHQRIAA